MKFEKLSSEEKVNLSINMVDVCTNICEEGIRSHDETTDPKKILEELRVRVQHGKRCQKRV